MHKGSGYFIDVATNYFVCSKVSHVGLKLWEELVENKKSIDDYVSIDYLSIFVCLIWHLY
jgi:hypothetical protein